MRRSLLLLLLILGVLSSFTASAQEARLTAPKNVCLNSYATMHAFLTSDTEDSVRWTIDMPSGPDIVHSYARGAHPLFKYMSPTHGQSVTFLVNQLGTYKVTVRVYYTDNGHREYETREQSFTVYDCSMDECEGTYTPATNFKETFGNLFAGAPRRQVVAPASIEYQFASSGSLADDWYSIYWNSQGGGRPEWDYVEDHTDDGYGGMLIANSSDNPKKFYTRPVNGLCAGAKYNFSAWFINLNSQQVLNSTCEREDYRYAGVTFIVKNASNNSIIAQFNTYDVSMDLSRNLPGNQRLTGWQKYGGTVTLNPGEENVIVEIQNNNPGGCGNDIAVDDIEFVFCAPKIYSYIDGLGVDRDIVCPGAEMTLTSVIEPSDYFADPVYVWEMSKNSGAWGPVTEPGYTGANTPILNIGAGVLQENDVIQYRLMVFERGNTASRTCYTPSNMVVLSVPSLPQINASRPQICRGDSTIITATPLETPSVTGYESFDFTGPNILTWPTIPPPKNQILANPTTSSTYVVTGSIKYGRYLNGQPRVCMKTDSIRITVDDPVAVALGADLRVCTGDALMLDAGAANAPYDILWSPDGQTTRAININAPSTASTVPYMVRVVNGECSARDTVNITGVPLFPAAITSDTAFCARALGSPILLKSTTLSAGYTGTWSIVGADYGASIVNPNSALNGELHNLPYDQPIRIRWTVTATGTNCTTMDEKIFINESRPVSTPGSPQVKCSNVFTMAANDPGAGNIGTWRVTAGTATIDDEHDPTTTVTITGAPQTVTLEWKVEKAHANAKCAAQVRTVTLQYVAPPAGVVNSGNVITSCVSTTSQFPFSYTTTGGPNSYDLEAVAPNPMPGFTTLTNRSITTSTVNIGYPSSTPAGTYTFRMILKKTTPAGCNTDVLFSVRIETPSTPPTSITAAAPTICAGSSTTLTVNGGSLGSGAQWVWYAGGCGSGTPIASGVSSITVSPSANTTYYVRAEGTMPCANTTCASATVSVDQMPVNADTGADQTHCNNASFTLTANTPGTGTGTWTVPAGITLTGGNNNPTATVNVPAGQSVTLTWTITNGTCTSVPDNVTLTNLAPITDNEISADQLLCPGSQPAQLTGVGVPSGGTGSYTYQWQMSTTSATTGFTDVTSAIGSIFQPPVLSQTTWYRRVVTSGTCSHTSDAVEITISSSAPVVGSTPADASVQCQSGTDYTTLFGTPSFTHPDGYTLSITYSDATVTLTCGQELTRTWTATDPCGRTASTSQTITVIDTVRPILQTPPANVTANCDNIPAQVTLTATDGCSSATVVPTSRQESIAGGCTYHYRIIYTWTATDACGNKDSVHQIITVQDTTRPVLQAPPADATVNCDNIPVQVTLTATDNCGSANVVPTSRQEAIGGSACANGYRIIYTWTATDQCGNIDSVHQVLTVQDTTRPVLQAPPANVTANCDAIPAQVMLTATDNCGTAIVTTASRQEALPGACANNYTLIYTWIATDLCGNQDSVHQIITVQDTTRPVLQTPPADATVDCDNIPVQVTLTATDNCGTATVVPTARQEAIGGATCASSYRIIYTWTATDQCDNIDSVHQVLTVQDTTKPVLQTPPANVTADCDNIPVQVTLTATDNCGTATVVPTARQEAIGGSSCTNNYRIIYTWTATDECGNIDSVHQVLTIQDTARPVLQTPPANVTADCDNIPTQVTLTATDNCGTASVVPTSRQEAISGSTCANSYRIIYTWTATDECGNIDSVHQVLTVQDTTRPTFDMAPPAAATADCDNIPTPAVLTASDNCGTATVAHFSRQETIAGACPNNYTLIYTWIATDICGNQDSVHQIITIQDTTRPVLQTPPADATVDCDNIPVQVTLTATDNCGTANVVPTSRREAIGATASCANSYRIIYTWTATDQCGNIDSVHQVLTIQDTTRPVLQTPPANVTADCDNIPAQVVLTATDNCGATTVTTTSRQEGIPGACLNNYTLIYTWIATDICGNRDSVHQVITVQDTTRPVLQTPPADAIVDCDNIPVQVTLTATDNCGTANVVPTSRREAIGATASCANSYRIIYTWTATDQCGNIDSVHQVLTIQDTTRPVLQSPPANVTADCDNIPAQVVLTATDNCGTTTVTTASRREAVPGACSNNYTLIYTWIATDVCGNQDSVHQIITVQDTTRPVLQTPPANTTVNCDNIPAPATLTATDNCGSASVVPTSRREAIAGACTNNYRIIYTWTATDLCGNEDSVHQTLTVQDTTRPTFDMAPPAAATADCDNIPVPAVLTASDNCGTAAVTTASRREAIPGACSNNYTLIYTWIATDLCGNQDSVHQTITVQDTTRPVLQTPPANATVNCDNIPAQITLTATDNCGTASVVPTSRQETIAGACVNNYRIIYTWTATDLCGNKDSVHQILTVQDTTRPVFDMAAPANVTADCHSIPLPVTLTASDNCGTASVSQTARTTAIPGACGNNYRLIYTWIATDLCGNVDSVHQIITIQDTSRPVLQTPPANVTANCDNIPAQATLTALDNCGTTTVVPTSRREAIPGACVNNYRLIYTWTATDQCGNKDSVHQIITVQDTTRPVLVTPPAGVTANCHNIPVQATLTATDNCGTATVVPTSRREAIPGACVNNYRLIYTWTATDLCGNKDSVHQIIIVQDTTRPVLMTPPANVTANCNSIPAQATLTATDNCGTATVVPTSRREAIPGACVNNYRLIYTWTATDLCGNKDSVHQIITVQDTTRPVLITPPAGVTANCDNIPAQVTLTATDNCGTATVVPTSRREAIPGACVNNYRLIYTWTATDLCGNKDSVHQIITVQDTSRPVLQAPPANVTANCDNIPVQAILTATDNCGTAAVTRASRREAIAGACVNNFRIIYTWIATDLCGNKDSVHQIVTVQDTTRPVLVTPPAGVTANCDNIPSQATLTATDNCGTATVTRTSRREAIAGACVNNYRLIYTWTATDRCGNKDSVHQIITVQDTARPVLQTPPAGVTANCDNIPAQATLTATDNCGTATVAKTSRRETIPGACVNNYRIIYTWIATDLCGNKDSVHQIITVQDTTRPVLQTPPAGVTANCDNIPAQATLTATDNCGTASVARASRRETIPGACVNNYRIIYTWIATDQCGNRDSVHQIITVQDTTRPVLQTPPAGVTANCDNIPAQATLTATDNCGTASVTRASRRVAIPGACVNNYRIIYTWIATDQCGNRDSVHQIITVQDTTRPVLMTPPANATAECDNIPVQVTLTATDNCGTATVVRTSRREAISGACANNYRLIYTWTATDQCGNKDSVHQIITVIDTTAPVFSTPVPANATVLCNAIPQQAVLTAIDNCSPAGMVNVFPNESRQAIPGRCVNNYLLVRTWTAVDECNNSRTVTQTITVIDTLAPVFTTATPTDTTVICSNIPSPPNMRATDNCSLSAGVRITYNQVRNNLPGACANNYQLIRTWTATDECGNARSTSQRINVIDTIAPVFTTSAPADVTVECNAIPVQPTMQATDNCSVSVNVVYDQTRVNGSCANNYQLIRTWTAMDECGNTRMIRQTITVMDRTKPAFTSPLPRDTVVDCSAIPASVTPTANDNCSAAGSIHISYNQSRVNIPGACANEYRLMRTWIATDECGNSTTYVQTITVQDTTKPVFTSSIPRDTTVNCQSIPPVATVTATDNCSGNRVGITPGEQHVNGTCANSYQLIRTWTATDECGNSRVARQVITVQDTTRPVFVSTAPANATVECNAIPQQPDIVATDNCSPAGSVVISRQERMVQIPGARCAANYQLIRTWTATDQCGNSTTMQQVLTVVDRTAPTFTMPVPANATVECNAIPQQPDLTVTDNCTPTNMIRLEKNEQRENIPGACVNNYRLIRTWTAIDLCGNRASVRQVLTVTDRTAPTFTVAIPADATVECNAIPQQPMLTATDNCTPSGNVTVTRNERREDIPGACVNNYRLIRTWIASDECGNTTTRQQVLTVVDRTAPTFMSAAPADITVECSAIPIQPVMSATDNCSPANRVTVVPNQRREDIPGACANNYRLIRTWTATDECGNSRTISQTITVQDTTRPVFTTAMPANITVSCDAIPDQPDMAASDNCTATNRIVITKNERRENIPGACTNSYLLIRTWTAADECGNTSSFTQTVTVQDMTPPVFTIVPPANVTVDCGQIPAVPRVTATDNCSMNSVQIDFRQTKQYTSETCANNYRLTRTWTATDECGNRAIITQIVNVTDTTAPVFNMPTPADTTVSCSSIPFATTMTATDNCSVAGRVQVSMQETTERITGTCRMNYRLIRTWTAKDECGNTRMIRQVITVTDTTKPVIAPAPADITVDCGAIIPRSPSLTATDNCDASFPRMISYTEDPYDMDRCSGYTIVRRWQVSDACGNQADEVTQRIHVRPCPKPALNPSVPVNCSNDLYFTINAMGNIQYPVYTLTAITPANAVRLPLSQTSNRFYLNGATSASFVVTDGETGCVSDTVTYQLNYIPMPVVNLGRDTSICGGNAMILDAGPANFGYSIRWSTGETTQRIRVTTPGSYSVEVSNGICVARDTITIGVIPMPLIDLPDTTICRGQSVELNATVSGDGTYLWSTGATTPSILVSTNETFWVRVQKQDCITIDTINVTVNPPPDISLTRDTTICPGQAVMLAVSTNAGRIQWENGETGNAIYVSRPGDYRVAVFRDRCVVQEKVTVRMRPDIQFDLGPDKIICPGGSVLIDAHHPEAATYRWSDGDLNPVKSISQEGMYILGVLDKYCDRVKMDTLNVIVAGPPQLELGNDTTLCKGIRFMLKPRVQNATSYIWNTGETTANIEIREAGTYTVTAFNDCGSTTDQITIDYRECDSKPDVPNAFSPNGDGVNDVFRPVIRGPMYEYELRIYNRWGEMVFISKDPTKGWNGWYKGKPVDIATFVWWLSYRKIANGPKFILKGDVTVIK